MTGIIILCRYNSSRLPGKILKKINGKEILGYIMERLESIKDKYPIVITTSYNNSDDPIIEYCKSKGFTYFRGSLDNVSQRFLDCAEKFEFKNAVRINGDNLFLDVDIIEELISRIERLNLKFISNVKGRTYPKGVSVEIVNTDYYKKNIALFSHNDKEHVMTYFYKIQNERDHYYKYNPDNSCNYGMYNLAIDTIEDFENANNIIDSMTDNHINYSYNEIVELFKKLKK